VVAVQGPHDADAGKHRRAAQLDHQYQRLNRRLPFWRVILGFRKLGDEGRGITQGDKLAAVRQHDRFVKLAVRKGLWPRHGPPLVS
jgi:hypothetical protein